MILIEDNILEAANMSEQELKAELAVMLYAHKRLSFGQARKLAGMGYFDFEKQLFGRNIFDFKPFHIVQPNWVNHFF